MSGSPSPYSPCRHRWTRPVNSVSHIWRKTNITVYLKDRHLIMRITKSIFTWNIPVLPSNSSRSWLSINKKNLNNSWLSINNCQSSIILWIILKSLLSSQNSGHLVLGKVLDVHALLVDVPLLIVALLLRKMGHKLNTTFLLLKIMGWVWSPPVHRDLLLLVQSHRRRNFQSHPTAEECCKKRNKKTICT